MLPETVSLPYGIERSQVEFRFAGRKHGFLTGKAQCMEGVYEIGRMSHLSTVL
jgi:hypothetical protein